MRALVTGAGGKTGIAVARVLAETGAEVRALVHRPEHEPALRELGATEVMTGDMRNAAVWIQAMSGVDAVYHICPNMAPDETEIGRLAIDAAQAAEVAHFVYHSVLHPQTEAMPHHWNKLRVEEVLFESGLDFTILQPAPYMQNLLAGWESIRSGGYRVPYTIETRLSLVDLDDVAHAAAIVLTQPGHRGATYELAGTGPLSQLEVAEILAQELGHAVRAERIEIGNWERQARAAGLGEHQIQTLIKMFEYYEAHGLWGSPNVLTWLVDRAPTSLAQFARRVAAGEGDGP